MNPRPATAADVPDIARMHVQAWQETYDGLLPQSEHDRHNLEYRTDLWGRVIATGAPVSIIPGMGFAQIAPQRDTELRADYPLELYCLYTLRDAHGSGAGGALLRHAWAVDQRPFTAEVLRGNARATRFYQKTGGRFIKQTSELIDNQPITNIVFGWLTPVHLPD